MRKSGELGNEEGEKEAKRVDYTIITRYIKLDEYFNIPAKRRSSRTENNLGKSNNNWGEIILLTR
jgi:hypothetical protein